MKHKHVWRIIRFTDYFKKDRCDGCGLSRQWDRLKHKEDLK
jgi:hypothetical protein